MVGECLKQMISQNCIEQNKLTRKMHNIKNLIIRPYSFQRENLILSEKKIMVGVFGGGGGGGASIKVKWSVP